jgi:hypothetical protein
LTSLFAISTRRDREGKGMADTLHVLIIEGVPTDAELVEN